MLTVSPGDGDNPSCFQVAVNVKLFLSCRFKKTTATAPSDIRLTNPWAITVAIVFVSKCLDLALFPPSVLKSLCVKMTEGASANSS